MVDNGNKFGLLAIGSQLLAYIRSNFATIWAQEAAKAQPAIAPDWPVATLGAPRFFSFGDDFTVIEPPEYPAITVSPEGQSTDGQQISYNFTVSYVIARPVVGGFCNQLTHAALLAVDTFSRILSDDHALAYSHPCWFFSSVSFDVSNLIVDNNGAPCYYKAVSAAVEIKSIKPTGYMI